MNGAGQAARGHHHHCAYFGTSVVGAGGELLTLRSCSAGSLTVIQANTTSGCVRGDGVGARIATWNEMG
jgi:hypothetical protein|eukprot:SAG25_NODE_85_length_16527_cov_73.409240_17_plen_69_part_00